jgi:hypothetical protein
MVGSEANPSWIIVKTKSSNHFDVTNLPIQASRANVTMVKSRNAMFKELQRTSKNNQLHECSAPEGLVQTLADFMNVLRQRAWCKH